MSAPIKAPPPSQQLAKQLALFKPSGRNLLLKTAAIEGGNAWVAAYLALRFTDYARAALGYRGPDRIGTGKVFGELGGTKHPAAARVISGNLQGWNPFRDAYPPSLDLRQYSPFARWYQAAGKAAQGRSYRSETARRNWYFHTRREFRRWAKALIRHAVLTAAGISPNSNGVEKLPFVKTGAWRTAALAGVRPDATSTSTRGLVLVVRIPTGHAVRPATSTRFRSVPDPELPAVERAMEAALVREVGQATVRPARRGATPRAILASAQAERLRAALNASKAPSRRTA
jgi:hypothetical protein